MKNPTHLRTTPSHPLRVYKSASGPRVYFSVKRLEDASASDVGEEMHRKARYIEAVHKSGRARVLKDSTGPTGYLDATTEPRK